MSSVVIAAGNIMTMKFWIITDIRNMAGVVPKMWNNICNRKAPAIKQNRKLQINRNKRFEKSIF